MSLRLLAALKKPSTWPCTSPAIQRRSGCSPAAIKGSSPPARVNFSRICMLYRMITRARVSRRVSTRHARVRALRGRVDYVDFAAVFTRADVGAVIHRDARDHAAVAVGAELAFVRICGCMPQGKADMAG